MKKPHTALGDPGVNTIRVSSVLMLDASKTRCWLEQRRAGTKEFIGYWGAGGGKGEPGESAEETARREIEEEAGVEILHLHRAGTLILRNTVVPLNVAFSLFMGVIGDQIPKRMEPKKSGPWKRFTLPEARCLLVTPPTQVLINIGIFNMMGRFP